MSDLLLDKASKRRVFDGFNRADSPLTLGTTDTGKVWVPRTGFVWGINSGKAYCVTAGSRQHAHIVSDISDGIVNVTIPVFAGQPGLIFRLTDEINYWRLICATIGPPTVYLAKVVADSATSMAEIPQAYANGDRLSVGLIGSQIKVYRNGILLATVTDAFGQTQTKHGIGFGVGNITCRFDNFSVEAV